MRMLLLPFSWIYGMIIRLRNWAFDLGILKSTSFDVPIINIGNLSTGGTGKTPMALYLAKLLSFKYKVAILSRGYGRATKGFRWVTTQSTAREGNADLVAANQFTESNLEKLREDAAVGEGDYLDSLGLLLGVPRARLNDFGHLAKERYAELFSRGDSSSQQIVMSLNEAVRRYPWFRN